MPYTWIVPPDHAWGRMTDAYMVRVFRAIATVMQRRQVDIELWMKENAWWTDRTGNARQGLACDLIVEALRIVLLLVIGRHPDGGYLSYGKYLELAHGGKYAIVAPAVDYWGPIILSDVRALLR